MVIAPSPPPAPPPRRTRAARRRTYVYAFSFYCGDVRFFTASVVKRVGGQTARRPVKARRGA